VNQQLSESSQNASGIKCDDGDMEMLNTSMMSCEETFETVFDTVNEQIFTISSFSVTEWQQESS
jgi:hypothetical protein